MDPNKSVQIEMPEWMVTQIARAAFDSDIPFSEQVVSMFRGLMQRPANYRNRIYLNYSLGAENIFIDVTDLDSLSEVITAGERIGLFQPEILTHPGRGTERTAAYLLSQAAKLNQAMYTP